MVWIQVWTDPQEFIRSETIESVYYRPLPKGTDEDWIEVVARPSEKVILQVSVNAGAFPKSENDQQSWQMLFNARAIQVIADVVKIISDPDQKANIVSLKDLITFDFVQEAPRNLDIEIWVWDLACHHCGKETPVVYPVGSFFGFMLEFNFLSNLPLLLSEKYPFYTKAPQKGKEGEEFHNTCQHCGHSQPDWRVMESYLELVNRPERVKEKVHITVPLTAEERDEYRKAGISSSW
ncbi:MAG: hypothetical protein CVV32_04820 [Methanomicrobiales archaeon HGW-Methanomicrobiales-3]|jgi:hypothetical protein|nr:MAG: hypothetical protein CVV32_04820 [Methanomicrobiales archaeon HGW-Methanomicrobiales-3]